MPFFFQRIIAHNNAHYNLMRLVLLIEMLLGILVLCSQCNFIKVWLSRPKMQMCVNDFHLTVPKPRWPTQHLYTAYPGRNASRFVLDTVSVLFIICLLQGNLIRLAALTNHADTRRWLLRKQYTFYRFLRYCAWNCIK